MAVDRKSLVAMAASQVGYKEAGFNKTKYGVWYGMQDEWCNMFVAWCAAQCGIPESIIPKYAYVPYTQNFYELRGRWRPKSSGYTPKPGDLVIYGTCSHIGIIEKTEGRYIYAIEGNTSSGGNVANGEGVYRRKRDTSWVMGYCVPDLPYEVKKEDENVEKKNLEIKNTDTGRFLTVEAVLVDEQNYVKLRDVEKLFPVVIGWDGKYPTIKQNFNK